MYQVVAILSLFIATIHAVAGKPETVLQGYGSTCAAPHRNGNFYAADIVRHNGMLLMYYGGQGADGHDRIHLATSTDQKTWAQQGVVLAPEGINHANDPSVVIADNRFYMFYTRARVGVTDCIGLAISADGRTWLDRGPVFLPRDKPAWDSLLVGRPSVIHDGSKFRMWFDGRADLPINAPDPVAPKSENSRRYVGYAVSKDGQSWQRRDKYCFANDAGGVHVSIVDGHHLMMIESRHGTKWATSKDGLEWKDQGLLVSKDQTTSPYGHVTPFLFSDGTKQVLYFGAAYSEHWNQNSIMRVPIPALVNIRIR